MVDHRRGVSQVSATSGSPERSRIFINYRRSDSETAVGRLADDLRRQFTPEQIFQDINSIDPGSDFSESLQRGLETCAATLVVIGPRWLDATDGRGNRRLDLPDDWARREIAASLSTRGVGVFPVLVENASMPASADLPENIRALCDRQAFALTTWHWRTDLVSALSARGSYPEWCAGRTGTADRGDLYPVTGSSLGRRQCGP